MSKRSADHQITKDELERGEEEVAETAEPGTWSQASEDKLKQRTFVKAKRRGAKDTDAAPAAAPAAPAAPAFPSFNFGAAPAAATAEKQPGDEPKADGETEKAEGAKTEGEKQEDKPVEAAAPAAAPAASDKWRCTVCRVLNEKDASQCACCEAPNPAAAAPAAEPVKAAVEKWRCTLCRVLNEPSAEKCACCENPNPNPSTTTAATEPAKESTSQFTFGASSSSSSSTSSGFTFGASSSSSSTFTFGTPASSSSSSSGFSFGSSSSSTSSSSSSSGFTFSFGSAASSSSTSSSSSSSSGFTFSFPSASSSSSESSTSSFGFASSGEGASSSFGSLASNQNGFTFNASTTPFNFVATTQTALTQPAATPAPETVKENTGEEDDIIVKKIQCRAYQLKTVVVEKATELVREKDEDEKASTTQDKEEAKKKEEESNKKKQEDEAAPGSTQTKYVEIGMGELHVNNYTKDDKTKARLILRAAATQRLVLNAPLYPAMTIETQSDKYLRFASFDLSAQRATFLLKFKNSAEAQDTQKAIKQALSAVTTETTA